MTAPRLRIDFNLGNLRDLPAWSAAPPGLDPKGGEATLVALAAAGYEGVQMGDPVLCRKHGLVPSAAARFVEPDQIDAAARRWADEGQDYATCHLGTEIMDEAQVDALVEAVLVAIQRHRVPIYPELHRATCLQDGWRTVQLVRRFPELRFNGDVSHWYTGHEMPYGDFAGKLAFYQPVWERVRCFHGRIGNTSHVQVELIPGRNALAIGHFRDIWRRCMSGYLASGEHAKALPFAPELLGTSNRYAREFLQPDGTWREESDRWLEALELVRLARELWAGLKETP